MKSKFILSALTLLGFSGCSENGGIFNEPDMYGTPLVDYRFIGELTDADGNPIKGIEVKINSTEEVVTTDNTGTFSNEFTSYADGFHSVTFTDVDGAENGGEFATKQVEVEWTDAEEVDGRDQFDLGTIILDAKEE
ncbi:MAG: radical SAM-associated putative lipoprotein [Rikenellaceae bacterium]